MDDFIRYLNEIVDPTVADFEANPASERHAFLACVATFHSVDYLAFDKKSERTSKSRVGNLKNRFGGDSPDFGLVDQVAHAFKHAVTGRPGERLKSEAVKRHGGAFSTGFSSGFDVSRVTIAGRPDINLLETVKRAVEFLRRNVR